MRWRRSRSARRRRGRATRARASVLTGVFAWHSAARNDEKSCVPINIAKAALHRGDVERLMVPAGAAGEQAGPLRRASAAGRCNAARVAAKRAWKSSATTGCAQSTATRRRKVRVDTAHPRASADAARRCRSARSATSACTPASVRPAAATTTARCRRSRQRPLERVLDTATRRLRLEAAERAAGVFDGQCVTHGASGIRGQESGQKTRAPDRTTRRPLS